VLLSRLRRNSRERLAGFRPAAGLYAAVAAVACDGGTSPARGDAGSNVVAVDVGVTGGPDGLDFVALEPGGEIALHTFGQGGTHALLAVRCIGLGDRAFVSVAITNVETGRESVAPAGTSPRLLLCEDEDEQTCDLLPLLLMTGALTAGSDGTSVPVLVSAEARNADGAGASVEREAVLSTLPL
jgi:hypothetical protein